MSDLEKRVSLLEKRAVCKSDSEDCPSQSCDLTRCPLMHDLVHQAQSVVSDKEEDYFILMHLVNTILEKQDIPSEMVILAKKKAEKEAILRRSRHIHQIMATIEKNKKLRDVFDILQQENHTRLNDLDKEIADMEKKTEC